MPSDLRLEGQVCTSKVCGAHALMRVALNYGPCAGYPIEYKEHIDMGTQKGTVI